MKVKTQCVSVCVSLLLPGDDSFTSNKLELTRVQRGPGLNDVGMVAWQMTLKTPECQQGRQVRDSSRGLQDAQRWGLSPPLFVLPLS